MIWAGLKRDSADVPTAMRFYIDSYHPVISGWVLPDNPSAQPTLTLVLDGGRERRVVPADIYREDLKALGLHATGHCSFQIDAAAVTGADPARPIEIYEHWSNVLLCRRAKGEAALQSRIFLLETQTRPLLPIARRSSAYFEDCHTDIETLSEDTTISVVVGSSESHFVSGRVLFRNLEGHLRAREYKTAVLLPDPVRELADKLLLLKQLSEFLDSGESWKQLGQHELTEALGGVDLTNPADLKRALMSLDDDNFLLLANPTTRKLTANTRQQPIEPHHVPQALSALASFDVVGAEPELDAFLAGLEEICGVRDLPAPSPPSDGVAEVMAALRRCPALPDFVSFDEAVYNITLDALRSAPAADEVALEPVH